MSAEHDRFFVKETAPKLIPDPNGIKRKFSVELSVGLAFIYTTRDYSELNLEFCFLAERRKEGIERLNQSSLELDRRGGIRSTPFIDCLLSFR